MDNWGIISLLIVGALYITPFILSMVQQGPTFVFRWHELGIRIHLSHLSYRNQVLGYQSWKRSWCRLRLEWKDAEVARWTTKWDANCHQQWTICDLDNSWMASQHSQPTPPRKISGYFWGGICLRGGVGWLAIISEDRWCFFVSEFETWTHDGRSHFCRPLKLSDFEDGMPAVANCFSSGWAVLLDLLDNLFPARISQDSPGGQPGFFPFLGTFFPSGADYTQLRPEQANLYASLQEWSLRQSQAKKV